MTCSDWLLVQVKAFYSYRAEPATVKNLKRGVASLLQLQLTTGKTVEVNYLMLTYLLNVLS